MISHVNFNINNFLLLQNHISKCISLQKIDSERNIQLPYKVRINCSVVKFNQCLLNQHHSLNLRVIWNESLKSLKN